MVRSLSLSLALCLLCALAAPASAGWYPAETIDGPSADVVELGDVDLARDGTGAVAYVKFDAGVPHVFVSRKVGGAWRAPERVDVGVETAASQVSVAATDGHRLLIAWISAGRLYGSVVAGGGGAPGPIASPTLLYEPPNPLEAARTPHADMGINSTGYIVFTAPGGGGSDVRAVRLSGTTFQGVDAPLDIQADQAAGGEGSRPRVGVSAEGNAVAVWGEDHPDGRRRVYGRRITGVALSLAPQEISLASYEGTAGGNADSPDLEVEDDGSYAWAVFRQDFGGGSRVLARRLVGSLFEAPSPIEGTGFGETPRIGMTGRGVGYAVAAIRGANSVHGAWLLQDVFESPVQVTNSSDRAPLPVVGTSEKDQVAVAWRGSEGSLWGKHKPYKEPFEVDHRLTDPALGVAAENGLEISEDRQGNFAVAFVQGDATSRRLMVAEYDRVPGVPVPTSTTNAQNRSKPVFKWRPGLELWGPVTFKVILDGEEIGRTTSSSLRSKIAVDDGPHRWQVVAIDRRGQETPAKERTIRIDKSAPEVRLRLDGKKKAGATLKYRITADDFGGSGLKTVLVDWGDRSPVSYVLRGVKRFGKAKTYRVRLKAVDKAGNIRQVFVRVRIKK
jgi:hypothetical protein